MAKGDRVVTEVGVHYRRSRERLTDLLSGIGEDEWQVQVPACPSWRVHDVLAHLVGNIEDAMAGELTQPPPSEAQTAAQVERHRNDNPSDLLERWTELAPPAEQFIGELEIWEAAGDAVSHEQDIRGALARPGARDDELILVGARRLIERLDLDVTIEVDLGDALAETAPRPGTTYRLEATPFEVFRFRLGRRSREQVVAFDWSPEAPPDGVIDKLFMFGPATAPLIE